MKVAGRKSTSHIECEAFGAPNLRSIPLLCHGLVDGVAQLFHMTPNPLQMNVTRNGLAVDRLA